MSASRSESETREAEATCCVCGTTDDLRCAPLMTGDRLGQPAKYPVCSPCLHAWYDSGTTTAEGILAYRRKYESSMLRPAALSPFPPTPEQEQRNERGIA